MKYRKYYTKKSARPTENCDITFHEGHNCINIPNKIRTHASSLACFVFNNRSAFQTMKYYLMHVLKKHIPYM